MGVLSDYGLILTGVRERASAYRSRRQSRRHPRSAARGTRPNVATERHLRTRHGRARTALWSVDPSSGLRFSVEVGPGRRSGPQGAANRRRRDRRRRGGILVGQGEWWSPFGVKGHGEPGFGPRSVEVMAARVRVPWAYLRHAAAAGDMKPCGHDHRELTHLDSTTPGGGSCRYCEPPDGRGPILTPRHWRGSGSRRRAARSRRASTAVGRRRRDRCCGRGGLRREL